ncbi:MAG: DNA polymerase [Christensenellales bacterium]
MSSPNYNRRQFGERAAMNTPVQGAAADIIKIAMNAVHDELKAAGLAAKLILQVHDELIVEAPEAEREQVEALLRRCMENAASLRVPLIADVHSGRSWYDTKVRTMGLPPQTQLEGFHPSNSLLRFAPMIDYT